MPCVMILLIFLFSNSVLANIYTWEDEKGVVHFSESKPAHAQAFKTIAIDLPNPKTYVQGEKIPYQSEEITNSAMQERADLNKVIKQRHERQ